MLEMGGGFKLILVAVFMFSFVKWHKQKRVQVYLSEM